MFLDSGRASPEDHGHLSQTSRFINSGFSVKRWLIFIITSILALAADLGTKYWAFSMSGLKYHAEGPRDMMTIIPGWFDFTLAMNTGAAFSMFAGKFTFFMIISVIAFLTLIYFVHMSEPTAVFQPLILGLIFAGVVGNFWDRVVFEGVRDFIAVHTPDEGFLFISGRYEWPTFNVADIWICVGAITMGFFFWKTDDQTKPNETPVPEGEKSADSNKATKSAKNVKN
jgi:signal peptidase II